MDGEITERAMKKRAFLPGKEERILTNNILGGTNGEMIIILTVKKDAGKPCNMEDKTRKDNGKDTKNPMGRYRQLQTEQNKYRTQNSEHTEYRRQRIEENKRNLIRKDETYQAKSGHWD